MMTTPVLILSPRRTPESLALRRAARKMGWSVCRVRGWQPRRRWDRDAELHYYGEPALARTLAIRANLAFLDVPGNWLVGLPLRYRQRSIRSTTLGEARALCFRAFVKPAWGDTFHSDIYSCGANLPRWNHLPDSLPTLVSEVVRWQVEVRCFVLNRQVAAMSAYARDGLWNPACGSRFLAQSEVAEARQFLATFFSDSSVGLPAAVVIDIGRIAGQGWAVVEANPAWASGIYGCDPEKVLPVVRRASVKRCEITDADIPWIVTEDQASSF